MFLIFFGGGWGPFRPEILTLDQSNYKKKFLTKKEHEASNEEPSNVKSQNDFYYLLIKCTASSIGLINIVSSILSSVLKRNLTLSSVWNFCFISKLLCKNWKSILVRLDVCLIKDKQNHIFRPRGITPVSSININKTNLPFSFNIFALLMMKNFDVFTFNCANHKFLLHSISFLEAFPECKITLQL